MFALCGHLGAAPYHVSVRMRAELIKKLTAVKSADLSPDLFRKTRVLLLIKVTNGC